ncbi:FAD-dependent oxidoreductase [Donghicola sp. C2-DW-16]|uniref:D-amino-acid oxidase n=1 Tax=Donghicola mangrovi TaxID=2729614 RepID=A0ABX2PFN5_9RHOB|nr:FAD-dependent oxidoreductase [Donghicola mangrovi]NVO28203.1 FAD-dependent oxidoreductase [Donghicola mangrovi]
MYSVLGAGVAGLCVATALSERGLPVELVAGPDIPASHWAGGMLAPMCEGESAPPEVVHMGKHAADWWSARFDGVQWRGTLVVASPRDQAELQRFARATRGHHTVDPAQYEADLKGRFSRALYFPEEAHMDPRAAMACLRQRLADRGVATVKTPKGQIIDCRGLAARDQLPDLRAVRGEMLVVHAADVHLTRTVRLLHPRFPCYVVPRGNGIYMIGATMVESDDDGPITARALMEMLSAVYTIHPAFAEAQLLETGTGLRPSFPDNIPCIRKAGGRIHVNGMYRHGYLAAPYLAEELADRLTKGLMNAS